MFQNHLQLAPVVVVTSVVEPEVKFQAPALATGI